MSKNPKTHAKACRLHVARRLGQRLVSCAPLLLAAAVSLRYSLWSEAWNYGITSFSL